jgi:hypothetical protein
MQFPSPPPFNDRESKLGYVWTKYQSILEGRRILDVGADQCYLKRHLDPKATYFGIGLGGNPDRRVDLEKERIPLPDKSYDIALCLDVLEHIENPHEVFDDLCRVTTKHVVISLPNALANLWETIRLKPYNADRMMKFYGFPAEKPEDRHKWFLWPEEIERFIRHRAELNRMKVLQIDYMPGFEEGDGLRGWLRRKARAYLFRKDLDFTQLEKGTAWIVLEHSGASA